MQVSLRSLHTAAVLNNRTGGMLLSVQGGSFEPLLQRQAEELRERVRRDDEQEVEAAALMVPTRSADVIDEAERNIEHTSRAFRRQVAREGAAEQFRQDRQGFRQALERGGKENDGTVSRNPSDANAQSEAKSSPKASKQPSDSAANKAQSVRADSAKASSTPVNPRASASQAGGRVPMPTASATTAATASAGSMSTLNSVLVARMTSSVTRGNVGVVRSASAMQAQAAAKPSAAGGVKGNSQAQFAALSPRGSTKAGAHAATKADGSRPAENADRAANIKRIVRLVAQNIRGERSHTVMRLNPPELGSLRLQMDLKGETLTLRIDTSTHVAHRLLTEDVDKLRSGLEASGIQLERVEVRPPMQSPEASEQGDSRQEDTQGQTQEGFGETDAEHPEERGKDSHPAEPFEATARGVESEPATELLVNVVA